MPTCVRGGDSSFGGVQIMEMDIGFNDRKRWVPIRRLDTFRIN